MRVLLRIFLVLACVSISILLLIGFIYRDRRPHIYFAVEKGDTNSIALYLASGRNVNANINCYAFGGNRWLAPMLDIALQNGQIEAVDFLLKRGADPNQPDSQGQAPLMWVIATTKDAVPPEKRMQIFKMLLSVGADPHAPAPTNYRYTPLIEAASLGEADMFRALLSLKADVRATNKVGQAALHLAGGHTEVVNLLLAAGADVTAPDDHGETPIDYATRQGYTNTLTILTNALANQALSQPLHQISKHFPIPLRLLRILAAKLSPSPFAWFASFRG